jgi:hypothetical protein
MLDRARRTVIDNTAPGGEPEMHAPPIARIAPPDEKALLLEPVQGRGHGARIEMQYPRELSHGHSGEFADATNHEPLLGSYTQHSHHTARHQFERMVQTP